MDSSLTLAMMLNLLFVADDERVSDDDALEKQPVEQNLAKPTIKQMN